MFGANTRDTSCKMARWLLHMSRGFCAESSAGGCRHLPHSCASQELNPFASGTFRSMASFPQEGPSSYRLFSSEAAQGKVAEGQAAAGEQVVVPEGDGEEAPRLDAMLLRTILIASVIGAAYHSVSNGPGMYGSPATHAMLLKGSPQMRVAGLQRLKKCAETGKHQLELEEHRIPERLVALLMTETDLDVWRELCSTLAVMLSGQGGSQDLAVSGLCASLSQRLSREDTAFTAAAEHLLQKLAHYSDQALVSYPEH